MKKIKIAIILILTIIITTLYFYFYSKFTNDAAWNYGFAYNITKGLIPYKDYNMIITPLFPYLLSLLIFIFGNKLILYYIFIAALTVLTTYIVSKKIGYKSIIIYLLLLVLHDLGYNVLILFLFMILLSLIDKDNKNEVLIAIVISLMILTKQTLGVLIIPSIIFSKKKKKTIIIYIITILLTLIYLICNNSIYSFIDYCFLGMLDFTSKNSSKFTMLTIAELVVSLSLITAIIKGRSKNRELIYIFLFQIIAIPIIDIYHFIMAFIPVLYYILYRINNKHINYLIYLVIISFSIGYNIWQLDYSLETLYNKKTSFMYKKRVPNYLNGYFKYINKEKNNYKGYRIYILDSRAYLIKLELGLKINKYDLINNGNMGYKGSDKYIKEIRNYCKKNKCAFFINYEKTEQINKEIINYITKNYRQATSTSQDNLDNIYIN